jgi:hypothetical protein
MALSKEQGLITFQAARLQKIIKVFALHRPARRYKHVPWTKVLKFVSRSEANGV